ncbi:UNVERIFIED_CONTAM: hypothetical protein Slati_1165800 [Sesamum latifolium]|uniref:Retrotransposon gag domain-containing protein n=1 Tax=Sesamum latifolium TaxID=2727402 RepID=A0AAW2XG93_9LAMI
MRLIENDVVTVIVFNPAAASFSHGGKAVLLHPPPNSSQIFLSIAVAIAMMVSAYSSCNCISHGYSFFESTSMASSSNTVYENMSRDMRTAAESVTARSNSTEHSALEGKDRLGFIDGSCGRPTEGSVELRQWKITDSLVRTWILSTMNKDIVNAFLYASSARSLWAELEARYGESDGPLAYKIRREISSITQGNLSVITYYTNLKQYWDELVCLKPPAMCSCGQCICDSNKAKQKEIEEDHLMQFLMGLSEPYDNIRSQILVLDPLPSVNKAYSMILRVERQRRVNMEYADVNEKCSAC